MNEKFSILTASYNNCQFLQDWQNSIIIQDYRPLEVVFYNDASSDNTVEKFKEIQDKFTEHGIEYKFINSDIRKHYGFGVKTTFENATGNFFGFLDSDDMLSEGSVEHIMNLYNKHSEVGYIYTQFTIHDEKMKFKKMGWSQPPFEGKSLLDMGFMKTSLGKPIHTCSHWRTFSRRIKKPQKLWNESLRSGVDKYLFYRLEEDSIGGFSSRVCYKYRWGLKTAISRTEKAMSSWESIKKEAVARRKKWKPTINPIITLK